MWHLLESSSNSTSIKSSKQQRSKAKRKFPLEPDSFLKRPRPLEGAIGRNWRINQVSYLIQLINFEIYFWYVSYLIRSNISNIKKPTKWEASVNCGQFVLQALASCQRTDEARAAACRLAWGPNRDANEQRRLHGIKSIYSAVFARECIRCGPHASTAGGQRAPFVSQHGQRTARQAVRSETEFIFHSNWSASINVISASAKVFLRFFFEPLFTEFLLEQN